MKWRVISVHDVQDFIETLPEDGQHKVQWVEERLEELGLDIARTDWAKHVEGDLWELRVQWRRLFIRLFYYRSGDREFTIVGACKKKSNKTPRREKEIALETMRRLKKQLRH